MSTGIFITARLGSTRLRQKHLIKVDGLTFLEWLLKRMESEFISELESNQAKIFITTSTKTENKRFEDFSGQHVEVFYGSDDNIPLRHLQCAQAHGIENIIAIDGDDILCSPTAARLVLNELISNRPIAKSMGLPLGMNVMGYKSEFLARALTNKMDKTLETGWGKIFDIEQCQNVIMTSQPSYESLRMTLDYEKDAVFFETTIKSLGKQILLLKDEDLIRHILSHGWNSINEKLNDEYWSNFNKQKNDEN
ncbi:cytidylyltransferase domain-containing protein [Sphingobacterium sp.]|uniref:cytidylyltransferase domain-containing protein n=1 Tax=Sphingobacterium sp. TaxID=341027 RepID=UPI002FDEC9B2